MAVLVHGHQQSALRHADVVLDALVHLQNLVQLHHVAHEDARATRAQVPGMNGARNEYFFIADS